ncbi:MAG: AAA family ATPase [Candidatus Hydrogenedentes bacterium]|nr:AAA family ATPase [Candidatus Hydrogenedentota bacterium]
MSKVNGIFQDVVEFPNSDYRRRYESLIGLEDIKAQLLKEAAFLVNPNLLKDWSTRFHRIELPILKTILDRAPMFIFAGDVGTGKTALAESFGDKLARELDIDTMLHILSLTTRGTGVVGEMTTLVTQAFSQVKHLAQNSKNGPGKPRCVHILLVDEADSLTQSRENSQMHHEDRAGVNAVIRGIDDIAQSRLPILVVLCTNRINAIDPAIRRRAADIFRFNRPNTEQRRSLLSQTLSHSGITAQEIETVALATGPQNGRAYGFTSSDIIQRLLPRCVLDAYPNKPLTLELAMRVLSVTPPTPPFEEQVCE